MKSPAAATGLTDGLGGSLPAEALARKWQTKPANRNSSSDASARPQHDGHCLGSTFPRPSHWLEQDRQWIFIDESIADIVVIVKSTAKTRIIVFLSPSLSLFRGIEERLVVGARKRDIRLDPIIYHVERKSNLDDLTSVWNTSRIRLRARPWSTGIKPMVNAYGKRQSKRQGKLYGKP